MTKVSEAIQKHHRQLMQTIEEHIKALLEDPSKARPFELAEFLQKDLLPHAMGEEKHLYPQVDPLIKAHGQATATMGVDHEFIHTYIHQIGESVKSLKEASSEVKPALQEKLKHQVLQFEAVLRLHLEKEERVYLPLFERYLTEEEQQKVLEGMHQAYAHSEQEAEKVITELDVRSVPPPQRHPQIFQTFESLKAGEVFILINDHDPKPLYYQFTIEREGEFTWDYLEEGPEVWRVRIGKTEKGA